MITFIAAAETWGIIGMVIWALHYIDRIDCPRVVRPGIIELFIYLLAGPLGIWTFFP